MTPSVKMNFQSDKKFAAEFWACEGCLEPGHLGMRDTQHHIGICPGYEALREGRDLEKDSDLVNYFKDVLQLRAKTC